MNSWGLLNAYGPSQIKLSIAAELGQPKGKKRKLLDIDYQDDLLRKLLLTPYVAIKGMHDFRGITECAN